MPLEERGGADDSRMASETKGVNPLQYLGVYVVGDKRVSRAITGIRLLLLCLSNCLLDPPGKHADDLFWGKDCVQGRVWFLGGELAGQGVREEGH